MERYKILYEGGEGEEGAFICIEPRESDEMNRVPKTAQRYKSSQGYQKFIQ